MSAFPSWLVLLVLPLAAVPEPGVDVDLIIRGRIPVTAPQEWSVQLAAAGFRRVSIRSGRAADKLEIRRQGTAAWPVYHVTGYLNEDGSIVLPPRQRFTLREAAGLARWVRDLKTRGPEAAGEEPAAFGLTPTQLKAVRQDLRQAVRQSTQNVDRNTLLVRLARQLAYPLQTTPAVRAALREAGPAEDEWQGLSCGTALAALLRPAGLVLRPQEEAGRPCYRVVDSRTPGDSWPVGWSPDQKPSRLVPALLQRAPTQATEAAAADAARQIAERLGVPVLWDYNALAREGIAPDQVRVEIRAAQLHYASLLRNVLRQAGLTYEVRVDDDQRPFLWLTTIKPP